MHCATLARFALRRTTQSELPQARQSLRINGLEETSKGDMTGTMEEDRTIFEQLMAEKETGELLSFLLRLGKEDKRSFLVYAQMVRDMVRHKQEEGSSATGRKFNRHFV